MTSIDSHPFRITRSFVSTLAPATILVLLGQGSLIACSGPSGDASGDKNASSTGSSAAAPAKPASAAKSAAKTEEKDLTAMGVSATITIPEGSTVKDDGYMAAGKKSVLIRISKGDSFRIQIQDQVLPVADEKKEIEKQKMIPFTRWVKEEPDLLYYEGKGAKDTPVHVFELYKKIDDQALVCATSPGETDPKLIEPLLSACRTLRKKT